MTCEACEGHINGELSKLAGVAAYKTSYTNQSSIVTFYPSKVDVNTIEKAINKTGYKVERSNYTTASQKVPVQASTAGEKCCYETK
jgi:copper chaperone CopZ